MLFCFNSQFSIQSHQQSKHQSPVMDSFDHVKFEKENAIARFNRFRLIAKFWHFIQVVLILSLISWSTVRVPAILRLSGEYVFNFSAYLFNHHVVFLIGNLIIVVIFTICRKTDTTHQSGGEDLYDDYIKHSRIEPPVTETIEDEKHIVVVNEDESKAITVQLPQCDDVSDAIEKATKQIRRFQRTQSEKLKRDISVTSRPELRRSETDRFKAIVPSEKVEAELPEIEKLSNEEFQRTVDAFIDRHWSKRKTAVMN